MKDEALKLALETLESIQSAYPCETAGKRIAAIEAALAQPEQEPVGKLQEPTVERAWFTIAELNAWANKKILENPQWVMPKNEPERDETLARPERSMKVEGPLHVICQCDKCKPQIAFNAEVVGYVAPQRTWVGLTEEDWKNLAAAQLGWEELIEAVETKLKEKNNG